MSMQPTELPPSFNRYIAREHVSFEMPDMQELSTRIESDRGRHTLLDLDTEMTSQGGMPTPNLYIEYTRSGSSTEIIGEVGFPPDTIDPGIDIGDWMKTTVERIANDIESFGLQTRVIKHNPTTVNIRIDQTIEIVINTLETDSDMCRVSVCAEPLGNIVQNTETTLINFLEVYATAINAIIDSHELSPVRGINIVPRSYDDFEAPAIPDRELIREGELTFDQIGGLHTAKARLQPIAEMFRHPEAAKMYNVTQTSFLLYGPAGTGKTSLIQAFAHECQADLVEIPSTQIVDMWVGNSGKKLQKVFDEARKSDKRTVLFFDEFDSLGSSGNLGTNERVDVRNMLKRELTSLPPNVIVAAASNSSQHEFDSALVRSGRLEPIYAPIPNDEERKEVWAAILGTEFTSNLADDTVDSSLAVSTFNIYRDDLDIEALSEATSGLTGADFVKILQRCRMKKFLAYIALPNKNDVGLFPTVGQADVLYEIKQLHR